MCRTMLAGLVALLLGGLSHGPHISRDPANAASATNGPSVIETIPVGTYPLGVAVNPTTDRIYVGNNQSLNVSVIEGATNTVVATVPGINSARDIAVNPTTNRIYVSASSGHRLSVIDGTANSVTQIWLDGLPDGVGVNPVTNRIYVSNDASQYWMPSLSIVDGLTEAVIDEVSVGSDPQDVDVNSDTNRVYVAKEYGDNVVVVDGATNTVLVTVGVGDAPFGVAVNARTGRIYVANSGSDTVSVIDGATNNVLPAIPVGDQPHGVAVNPTTNRIYVANWGSNDVSLIDGVANTVAATVPVGRGPSGVAANPFTGRVYIANAWDNTVTVIQDVGAADSDGDGLLDDWERPGGGLDANGDGLVDLDLAALGASPWRKDVFVEVDYMDCAAGGCLPWDLHSGLRVGSTALVENAFANAPLDPPASAPPGTPGGVRLHIMWDEPISHNSSTDYAQFFELMDAHFGTSNDRASANWQNIRAAKRIVFHYALMIHHYSGEPEGALGGTWKSSAAFFVAMGEDRLRSGSAETVAAAFMHELGHSLGLGHGGGDKMNCKPNYLSVMNYSRIVRESLPGWQLDYSRQALEPLDEGNLSEPVGLGPKEAIPPGTYVAYGPLRRVPRPFLPDRWEYATAPAEGAIDWNLDGDSNDEAVQQDLNNQLHRVELIDFGFPGCGTPDNDDDGNMDEDGINGLDDDSDGLTDEDGPDGIDILPGYDDWHNLTYIPQRLNVARSTLIPSLTAGQFEAILEAAPDHDEDDVPTVEDNCPLTANLDQADNDSDGFAGSEPGPGDSFGGDACDPDDDNDGCTDSQEAAMGFNANAWYDFYDVPVPARAESHAQRGTHHGRGHRRRPGRSLLRLCGAERSVWRQPQRQRRGLRLRQGQRRHG